MRAGTLALLALAGCSTEANHLGNPLLLPVTGLATAAENAVYNARRREVSALVTSDFPAVTADLRAGGGPALAAAMDAARIPEESRPGVTALLQSDIALYASDPEALVVALMVLGP